MLCMHKETLRAEFGNLMSITFNVICCSICYIIHCSYTAKAAAVHMKLELKLEPHAGHAVHISVLSLAISMKGLW